MGGAQPRQHLGAAAPLRATGPSATCIDRHVHEPPFAISGSVTAKRVLRARADHARCQLAGFPDGDQLVAVWGSTRSPLPLLLLLLPLEPVSHPLVRAAVSSPTNRT